MVPVTAPDDAKPAAAAALARPDSAGKRKDAPAATGSRFRAAATMVVAMRRFQCERGERGRGEVRAAGMARARVAPRRGVPPRRPPAPPLDAARAPRA